MNKRGQYYLVAAILFIAIFFSLISIVNQSKKETVTRIYELDEEMKIESSKIMEYSSNINNSQVGDFTKRYSEYAGEDVRMYFIIGNFSLQEVYNYTSGEKTELETFNFDSESKILNATIEGNEHLFKFKNGENLYFVIIQDINGEKYILK